MRKWITAGMLGFVCACTPTQHSRMTPQKMTKMNAGKAVWRTEESQQKAPQTENRPASSSSSDSRSDHLRPEHAEADVPEANGQNIIITAGPLSQPHRALGEVKIDTQGIMNVSSVLNDAPSQSASSVATQGRTLDVSIERINQMLKQKATEQYKNTDAIMNVTYHVEPDGGVVASGLAVEFAEAPSQATQSSPLKDGIAGPKGRRVRPPAEQVIAPEPLEEPSAESAPAEESANIEKPDPQDAKEVSGEPEKTTEEKTVSDQKIELWNQYQQGTLTQEEYDQRRIELLQGL